jgi:hypothetical protein
MIGLMFLAVIVLWFAICFSLLFVVCIKKCGYLSKVFSFFFGVILLVAPFYDEILAKGEFEKICREGAVVTVDEEYARGKTVKLNEIKKSTVYGHTLLITKKSWSFKDVTTGEILLSWNEYRSDGGWLSRRLKLMGETGPFIFYGYCYPEDSGSYIFTKLNISEIQEYK